MEPQITPWRRAVCGDLTSVFDFKTPNRDAARLPDASALPARAEKAKALPFPKPPDAAEPLPRQEPGQRPARALPYAFEVAGHWRTEGLVARDRQHRPGRARPSTCMPPAAASRGSTRSRPASALEDAVPARRRRLRPHPARAERLPARLPGRRRGPPARSRRRASTPKTGKLLVTAAQRRRRGR